MPCPCPPLCALIMVLLEQEGRDVTQWTLICCLKNPGTSFPKHCVFPTHINLTVGGERGFAFSLPR